jgi:hypothetical protein
MRVILLLTLGAVAAAGAVEVSDTQSATVTMALPRQEFGPMLLPLPQGFTVTLPLTVAHEITVEVAGQTLTFAGEGGSLAGSGVLRLEGGQTYAVAETYRFTVSADAVFLQVGFPISHTLRWELTVPEPGEYTYSVTGAVRDLAVNLEGDVAGTVRQEVVGAQVPLQVATTRAVNIGDNLAFQGRFAATLARTATALLPQEGTAPPAPPTKPTGPPEERGRRAERAMQVPLQRLGDLMNEVKGAGVDLAFARLTLLLEASAAKGKAALLTGDLGEAEKRADEVHRIMDALRAEWRARKEIHEATEELAKWAREAAKAGAPVPEERVAEVQGLIEQATAAADQNRIEDAVRLAAQAEELAEALWDELKGRGKPAKDKADDAQKAAKDAGDAAREAEAAAADVLDAVGVVSPDAVEAAVEAARRASEEADRARERARQAKEKADAEGGKPDKDAAVAAEAGADDAGLAALAAAMRVAEAAARVAENARSAVEQARKGAVPGNVPSQRAAEAAMAAAENAARNVAEAAALVAENARRVAERAAERARASGRPDDQQKAKEAAEQAAQAAKDAAVKALDAADAAVASAESGAATDALEAAAIASEAARQRAKDAQDSARRAAERARKAAEKAKKALDEAAGAEQKAKDAGDDASRRAAERLRQAAANATDAAERAEKEARKAGKEATDLNDDGENDIVDLILVARVFGSLTVKLEVEAAISDVNGDGEVNIADLVLAVQGFFDGALLPALPEGVFGAPDGLAAAGPRVLLSERPGPAPDTIRLDVVAENVIDAAGFHFRLTFAPDRVEVAGVEQGPLMRSDGARAFAYAPDTSAPGTLSVAAARIAPNGVSGSGVLASVTLRARRPGLLTTSPLHSGTLDVADQAGRLARFTFGPDALSVGAAFRPPRSEALPNYPNPFNPETWIPYALTEAAEVTVHIYTVEGKPVRTLALGYRNAGYHTDRARAAYWDGRNASGEPVASGVYVYELRAGSVRSVRRMVVVK